MKKESKDKSNRLYNCKNRKEKKEYVKWKGFDNSYNSWIDKKNVVISNELFSRTM